MQSVIIKPKNEILRKYIQYFLFFNKCDNHFLNYTTFPNSNLCLAIYKKNKITYINKGDINLCNISEGHNYTSYLYGFHKMPFNVQIDSYLDQICIIFQPSALRAFTKESYENLMKSDAVFEEIFSQDKSILNKIFDNDNFNERADELEILLLKNLKNEIPERMKQAMLMINNNPILTLDTLSKDLKISETTLFRLFKDNMGQNPKSYLKTLRFRNVLQDLLTPNHSLTAVAYQNQYYDQAHFINDLKKFTGLSPKHLKNEISVNQKDLTWIYNKN
ncbi:hypothetical protein CMT56_09980 [Elizabethkingia anophelis]|uniref:helix-turn-helix domain-containing protein n=1 Tax=Elizabethkingia anophelis TaxID=1117645 RepID=UPI00293C2969|nr:hypothetical protein [Elizabethkingia anophelis]MDV3861264.1 hypothetical protein [Elizabethkingia anophelis]MDV3909976.1 hypothetical protein [Elizabethkingia anophelis]MDV3922431.1 hypothetical protein [Elizabethkingia anophelis]MDV3988343.1 hypothetical protein [Elizabethkingia anophelis]